LTDVCQNQAALCKDLKTKQQQKYSPKTTATKTTGLHLFKNALLPHKFSAK
jgi:hypothetical protein